MLSWEIRNAALAYADAGSSYSWSYDNYDAAYDPFSNGSDTDVAILYNENYLTLIGDDAVTVHLGSAYVDEGAANC